MAGVFDLELHDVETVEVDDSDDDIIEIQEVKNTFFILKYTCLRNNKK